MSTVPDQVQSDTVTIEVDGVSRQAPKGAMVIEVTDQAGVEIPRFCYHKKLSIVANCRMCLVEVEKAPKPLPACATPVADGMKIFTRSPKAIEAQRGTMEFLLINHPLDCPICDQGGECELQELSIGYGSDRSEYAEAKRVVKDKDIGPLIETEMTRCIHCTRCVRFGDEIGGMPELGATGRGEDMRIGTYIEKAMASELSGNVIDLCPVGALTSKPFRYTARAWEVQRHASVSPHDCVGSNLEVLTRGHKVMRVDPRENEAVNECWIADRDRFSYEGLNSSGRLLMPMIRRDGEWQQADWQSALDFVARKLNAVRESAGAEQIGMLASSGSTLEELYLSQELIRALGSSNIDHRLRQTDFRNQHEAPLYPSLGGSIADLEHVDAALVIGSWLRKDQPMINHRLRKAALRGASVMFVNPVAWDVNFPVAANLAVTPSELVTRLIAIARAVFEHTGGTPPAEFSGLLASVSVDDEIRDIARRLVEAGRGRILLGSVARMHPDFSSLQALARLVADAAGVTVGELTDGANAAGAWLAGAVPHRGPAGATVDRPGLDAGAMFANPPGAWLLLNTEPEHDSADAAQAMAAFEQAGFVVALTPYRSDRMESYADVMLPVAPFSETPGTFVNVEGRWQSFSAVVPPAGEARPAWKVLRVLGNLLNLPGFDYMSTGEVRDLVKSRLSDDSPGRAQWSMPELQDAGAADDDTVTRVPNVPIYAVDNIVRRAESLQQTADARDMVRVGIDSALAQRLDVSDGDRVLVTQGDASAELPVAVDDRVAPGCAWIPVGLPETCGLGPAFGPVSLKRHG